MSSVLSSSLVFLLKIVSTIKPAVMNKVIKKAMVDCDIEDYTALGLRMGMSRQAISRRMNDGGWKDEELWKLVRVLKLSAEQLAAMLGALPRPAA